MKRKVSKLCVLIKKKKKFNALKNTSKKRTIKRWFAFHVADLKNKHAEKKNERIFFHQFGAIIQNRRE